MFVAHIEGSFNSIIKEQYSKKIIDIMGGDEKTPRVKKLDLLARELIDRYQIGVNQEYINSIMAMNIESGEKVIINVCNEYIEYSLKNKYNSKNDGCEEVLKTIFKHIINRSNFLLKTKTMVSDDDNLFRGELRKNIDSFFYENFFDQYISISEKIEYYDKFLKKQQKIFECVEGGYEVLKNMYCVKIESGLTDFTNKSSVVLDLLLCIDQYVDNFFTIFLSRIMTLRYMENFTMLKAIKKEYMFAYNFLGDLDELDWYGIYCFFAINNVLFTNIELANSFENNRVIILEKEIMKLNINILKLIMKSLFILNGGKIYRNYFDSKYCLMFLDIDIFLHFCNKLDMSEAKKTLLQPILIESALCGNKMKTIINKVNCGMGVILKSYLLYNENSSMRKSNHMISGIKKLKKGETNDNILRFYDQIQKIVLFNMVLQFFKSSDKDSLDNFYKKWVKDGKFLDCIKKTQLFEKVDNVYMEKQLKLNKHNMM